MAATGAEIKALVEGGRMLERESAAPQAPSDPELSAQGQDERSGGTESADVAPAPGGSDLKALIDGGGTQDSPVGQTDQDTYEDRGFLRNRSEDVQRGWIGLKAGGRALGVLSNFQSAREAEQNIEALSQELGSLESADLPQQARQFRGEQLRNQMAGWERDLEQSHQGLAESAQALQQYDEELAEIANNPSLQRAFEDGSLEGFWREFSSNPVSITSAIIARSLPYMAASAAGGAAGGLAAGTAGAMAGAGTASGTAEFGMTLVDRLKEHGADFSDPESVERVLRENFDDIRNDAAIRGAAIGMMDAVGMGAAAKPLTRPARAGATTATARVGEAAAQGAVQGGTGAGGEAMAQLGTGEDIRPAEIAAEGIAEAPSAAVDVGVATATGVRQRGDTGKKAGREPDIELDEAFYSSLDQRLREAQRGKRQKVLEGPDDTLRADTRGNVGTERQFEERARREGLTPDVERAAALHPGRAQNEPAPGDVVAPAEQPVREQAADIAAEADRLVTLNTEAPVAAPGQASDISLAGQEQGGGETSPETAPEALTPLGEGQESAETGEGAAVTPPAATDVDARALKAAAEANMAEVDRAPPDTEAAAIGGPPTGEALTTPQQTPAPAGVSASGAEEAPATASTAPTEQPAEWQGDRPKPPPQTRPATPRQDAQRDVEELRPLGERLAEIESQQGAESAKRELSLDAVKQFFGIAGVAKSAQGIRSRLAEYGFDGNAPLRDLREYVASEDTAQQAAPSLIYRKDGQPFRNENGARLSMRLREMSGTPVQVDGGWAIQPAPEPAGDVTPQVAEAGDAQVPAAAYEQWTFRELRDEARRRDLSASGSKRELVQRLRDRDVIDAAGAQTDTEPTEAQARAGNYRKGRVRVFGREIAIENPRGSTRSGTAPDGTRWETTLAHDYGDIKGTTAADGDNLDVFLGPDSPESSPVFVVDQVNEDGSFDEHKVMAGFPSEQAAREGYLANYEKGWQGLGNITRMEPEEFSRWLDEGDHTRPAADLLSDRTETDGSESQQGRAMEPALPGRPRQESVGVPLPGRLLDTGGVANSQSGRKLAPFPRVDVSTDRKAKNTLRRVHKWLLNEAISEARARGDDFNETAFSGLDAARLSSGDVSDLNLYLFGNEDGPPASDPESVRELEHTKSAGGEGEGKTAQETGRGTENQLASAIARRATERLAAEKPPLIQIAQVNSVDNARLGIESAWQKRLADIVAEEIINSEAVNALFERGAMPDSEIRWLAEQPAPETDEGARKTPSQELRERAEELERRADELPIQVRLNDLPMSEAVAAHQGTSMTPERRGLQRQMDYVAEMIDVYETMAPLAGTSEKATVLKDELTRYKQGLLRRMRANLAAASRTMSPMVAGPSNFPTRRNAKRLETARKRTDELLEWQERARKSIRRKLTPESAPVSSTDPEAIDKLRRRLAGAREAHELMKQANRIIRRKGLTVEQRVEQMKGIGLTEQQARAALQPDFKGDTGFGLTNSNAQIRRLERRIQELESRQERAADGPTVVHFDGGAVELDYGSGYVKVQHDEKPSADVRRELKSAGFRWTPSEKVWRRKINEAAISAAERLTGADVRQAQANERTTDEDQATAILDRAKVTGKERLDILRDFREGRYSVEDLEAAYPDQQTRQADQEAEQAPTNTITVDGVERPRTNSEGRPIAPTEDGIRNFWRWFGDSQVVDGEGRPLVVYHGSASPDISAFDVSRAGTEQRSDWGPGVYFTPSRSTAQYYGREAVINNDPEEERLYQEYEREAERLGTTPMEAGMDLGINSPEYQRLQEFEQRWRERRREVREGGAGAVYEAYLRVTNPLVHQYTGVTDPYLSEQARGDGHDGVIIVNERPDPQQPLATYMDELLVFQPTQIKSATGNRGTFSTESDDIRFHRRAGTPESVSVVQAPDEVRETSPDDLWRETNEHLRDEVQGRTFETADGYTVRVGKLGRGKVLSVGRRDYRRMAVARALPELIRNAVIVDQASDRRARRGVSGFETAVAAAEVDGQVYPIKLTLKVTAEGGRSFYTLAGYEVESGGRAVGIQRFRTGAMPRRENPDIPSDSEISVADLVDAINRGEPSFRRTAPAEGMTVADVQAVTDGLMGEWTNAPDVAVIQSESGLPAGIRRAIESAGAQGEVRGVFWRGRAYVVADNVRSAAEVEETVLHEVVGHYGLRELLGQDFTKLLDDVYLTQGRSGLRDIAERYGFDLNDRTQRRQAAKEKLAHIAQANPQSKLWDRFVRLFADWARRMGFQIRLTSAEIRDLVLRARRFVETGGRVEGESIVAEHALYRGTSHSADEIVVDVADEGASFSLRQDSRAGVRDAPQGGAPAEDAPLTAGGNPAAPDWESATRIRRRDGSPAPVYRGSRGALSAADFSEEAFGRATGHPTAGLGVWFSASRLEAANYGAVEEYRLDVRNPKIYRVEDFPDVGTPAEARKLRQRLRGRGYDAVVVDARHLGGPLNIVVFAPDQVVRADDGPMFSRQENDGDPLSDIGEALERAGLGQKRGRLHEWAQRLDRLTGQRARWLAAEMADSVAQGAFDRFHGIKRAELANVGNLPAEQSAYVAARLSTGIPSTMRAILLHGAPQWQNGIIGKVEGSKGLLEVLEPVRGDLDTFLGWMVGRRAQRLLEEGRENLFEQRHIDALIENGERSRLYDWFEETAAELDDFKKRILDLAEEAGLIDPDGRAAWDQADYIPFYRVSEPEQVQGPRGRGGLTGQSSGIRSLKGGTAALNDPLENLLMNFTHLVDASMKNHAIRQVQRNLEGSDVLEQVSSDFKQEMVPLDQVKARIREQGGDPNLLPAEALQGMAKMWAVKPPSDPDVVRIMDEGKATYYRVHDPLLLRALTAVRDPGLNHPIVRTMRWFKRVLTRGVTADPAFMARNFARDMLHAWTINEDNFRLGVDSLRGVTKTLQEKGGAIDMMFAGGSFLGGYVNANDPGETARATRAALREKGFNAADRRQFVSSIVDTPAKWWEVYTRVGDAVENASREAVYEAAGKAGKSRAQSIFEAKDFMDYSMRGDWAITQFFGDVLPFFNARVQGLYKLGRAGARNPQKIAARGAVIALASIGLLARNWDDERYEDLPDWDKDAYWHIFLPEDVVGEDFAHLRIPKPFEVGVLFGTIPERIARNQIGADDTGKMFERFLWGARETFAFDPVPQAFNPLLEVWGNWDRFRGAPIEGLADQGKLSRARFDEQTSVTMRALGRISGPTAGLSPKELEHLLRGYTGQLGMYTLAASDWALRGIQGTPPRPNMRIDDWPVVSTFVRSEPMRSTKYLPRLYELHREVNQIYRTVREFRRSGDVERARELLKEERPKLRTRELLSRGAEINSDIRKQMDRIYRSESMSGAEKRKRIDRLITRRNRATKQVVQRVERILEEDEDG